MRAWVFENLAHVLCGLVLIARLGDVVSTRLASPKLELEANPVARRLGWPFILLSLLLCLVPYVSTGAALTVLVPSLLVSASNISRLWVIRAVGEGAYRELVTGWLRRTRPRAVFGGTLVSAGFVLLCGLVLMFFYPDPGFDWGFWFALGIVTYGLAMALHGCHFYWRLRRRSRESVPG
jgi:hypothetical protein